MGLDRTSIDAALLHDVVEDTQIKLEEIQEKFGPEVATLVDRVTKLSRISFRASRSSRWKASAPRYFWQWPTISGWILIKLADRMHNMRTLKYLPVEKQKKIARETLGDLCPFDPPFGDVQIQMGTGRPGPPVSWNHPEIHELVQKVAKKGRNRKATLKRSGRNCSSNWLSTGLRLRSRGGQSIFTASTIR